MKRRYKYRSCFVVIDYAHEPAKVSIELPTGETKLTRHMKSARRAIDRYEDAQETETVTITPRIET